MKTIFRRPNPSTWTVADSGDALQLWLIGGRRVTCQLTAVNISRVAFSVHTLDGAPPTICSFYSGGRHSHTWNVFNDWGIGEAYAKLVQLANVLLRLLNGNPHTEHFSFYDQDCYVRVMTSTRIIMSFGRSPTEHLFKREQVQELLDPNSRVHLLCPGYIAFCELIWLALGRRTEEETGFIARQA